MPSRETTQEGKSTGQLVLGLALLAPALLCCVTELLIPTVRTFWMSFQAVDLFRSGGEFVGLENY